MNDDLQLLANAYLDGELSTDEIARAEADPEVMAEVDRLSTLQAAVRDVAPPPSAVREAAIAAALSEFAVTSGTASQAITTMRFGRRPSLARYLAVAAAILVVGVLGVAAATGLRTGDDDMTASEPAATQSSDAGGAAQAESRLPEAVAGDVADDDVAGATAAAPAVELVPDNSALSAQDAAPSVRPIIDPTQPLATPDELGSFGSYLLELEASGDLPSTPNTDCPQQEILGETRYLFDGSPADILVAIDSTAGTVTGVDPDTCEPLVVGPLF